MANEKFRSPYSLYQIRLQSGTTVEPHSSVNFKPLMKITKQELIDIHQKLHGTIIGTLSYLTNSPIGFLSIIINKNIYLTLKTEMNAAWLFNHFFFSPPLLY